MMKRYGIGLLLVWLAAALASDDAWAQRRFFRRRGPLPRQSEPAPDDARPVFRRRRGPWMRREAAPRPEGRPTPAGPPSAKPARASQPAAPVPYDLRDLQPPAFSQAWYRQRPAAWYPAEAGDPFAAADPSALALWLGLTDPSDLDADRGQPLDLAGTQLLAQLASREAEPAQWMPVGVFALRPHGHQTATHVIQLCVAPEGVIRGTGLDLLAGNVYPVHGLVNKGQRRVAWTMGESGFVAFEAPVGALATGQARWAARYPDGSRGEWDLNRLTHRASP